MALEPTADPPIVLLLEPSDPRHHHTELLTRAGFRVVRAAPEEVNSQLLREVKPAIIAAERDGSGQLDPLDLTSRLRAEAPSRTIPTPTIVYGYGLSEHDIERAAAIGAMWLQLEPSDGSKLVAAIRGVLTAAGITLPRP